MQEAVSRLCVRRAKDETPSVGKGKVRAGKGPWDAAKASLVFGLGAVVFAGILVLASALAGRLLPVGGSYRVIGVLWMFGVPGVHIVAAGFALQGVTRGKRKLAAFLGLALNTFFILFWTVIVPIMVARD